MNKCNRCRKEKDIELFLKNNKELKTCIDCRENHCKSKDNWYKNNKDVAYLNITLPAFSISEKQLHSYSNLLIDAAKEISDQIK